ncbi:MAG: 16S rRNA (guanine(527)-N(7))-methyltransferase RsmG [Pseudomonadota bacterium]|nr:16S rRNA (guanine(527)-N(7))-methyltransferase RsmG [Pseudomonadota bacterium]
MMLDNVSRETLDKLEQYADLLAKWNPRINIVAKSTIGEAWTRHIVDSAQVFAASDKQDGQWLDMGSGGGFPGLVCAIIAAEKSPDLKFTLVDSDQRKCAFLRNVARETGTQVTVIAKRLEQIDPVNADVISARALANLSDLLPFAKRHGNQAATVLFQKGRNWQAEAAEASRDWRFQHEVLPSTTDPEAVILRIKELEHV